MKEEKKLSEEEAQEELKKRYKKAEELLEDSEKMERFLQRLEKKLKVIPLAGNTLAIVPVLISLIRSYVKHEYRDIPLGTIIAIISALIYVLTPIDVIPDAIVPVGYIDDAAVIAACLKLVNSDVEEYRKWRTDNHKDLDV